MSSGATSTTMVSRLANWGAAGLLAISAGLAVWRLSEVEVVLAGDDLILTEMHNISWDPDAGIFERLGPDPFFYLELPAGSIPLYEVRLDFDGLPQPGGWYLYPCSVDRNPAHINQDWVVTARVEEGDNQHSLIWDLEASQLARLDFPDELGVPLRLRQLTLTSRFATLYSPVFFGMILTAVAGLILLVAANLRRWLPQAFVQT